jgi:predicted aspartyl protease
MGRLLFAAAILLMASKLTVPGAIALSADVPRTPPPAQASARSSSVQASPRGTARASHATPPLTNGAAAFVPDKSAAAADALYAIPTRLDRIGRIIVPVMVNGQGPFSFVLDTGANATALTPHLARRLGLPVDEALMMMMNGVTGSAPFPTAPVNRVEAGAAVLTAQRLVVADASTVGADGVLGVDGFKDKVVLVDFIRDRVRVLDARAHRPSPELTRIPAKLRFGCLLIIDATVGSHRVKAVIDTGGQRTLGNMALHALLGLRRSGANHQNVAEVIGATEARQRGEQHVIQAISMGKLTIQGLVVTFGDFYVFKLWDLTSQPAIVIGMDMIGTLDTFGIDYTRDELQIRVRP